MPLEIEIKLKLDSHAPVRRRLLELQAELIGAVREENIFFDKPDASLRRADCGLRVRLTTSQTDREPKALLTFKGPAAATGLRVREALDLHMTPWEQVMPLLEALGFQRQYSFEKDRESWVLGHAGQGVCRVELDTLPVFGCFMEIEGPSEMAVQAVQHDLGLSHLPHHPESYARMVAAHLQATPAEPEGQRAPRELRF
jgi:adenylate cyclase class 2